MEQSSEQETKVGVGESCPAERQELSHYSQFRLREQEGKPATGNETLDNISSNETPAAGDSLGIVAIHSAEAGSSKSCAELDMSSGIDSESSTGSVKSQSLSRNEFGFEEVHGVQSAGAGRIMKEAERYSVGNNLQLQDENQEFEFGETEDLGFGVVPPGRGDSTHGMEQVMKKESNSDSKEEPSSEEAKLESGVFCAEENDASNGVKQSLGNEFEIQEPLSPDGENLGFGIICGAESEDLGTGTKTESMHTEETAGLNRNVDAKLSKPAPKDHMFQCRYCDVAFPYFYAFKTHERSHMLGPAKCKYCGKTFSTSDLCQSHERRGKCGKYLVCNVCKQSFRHEHNLRKHEEKGACRKNKSGPVKNDFKCKFCGRSFHRNSYCLKHERNRLCQKGMRGTGSEMDVPDKGGVVRASSKTSRENWQYEDVPKRYKCSQCPKMFALKETFTCHKSLHTGVRPFKCSKCSLRFRVKVGLLYHQQDHPVLKRRKCKYCNKTFNTWRDDFRRHQLIHTKCRFCDKSFISAAARVGHERRHTHEKQHMCQECGKAFHTRTNLVSHLRTHTDDRPHNCGHCGKAFKSKRELLIHERIHSTNPKPFSCKFCDGTFSSKCSLTDHERLHTGERFNCKYCDKGFAKKHSRLVHERTHTGERPYECLKCGRRFRSGATFWGHSQRHQESENPKIHKCDVCQDTFAVKKFLDQHKYIHQKEVPESCVHCDEPIRDMSEFLKHERIHRGRRYKCRFCEKESDVALNITVHERTHTGEKPYECQYCEKAFTTKHNLQVHEQRHLGVKRFECEVCSKLFLFKQELDQHMRCHTGVAPYQCRFCHKTFRRSGNLQVHERVHTGVRPFKCDLCDAAFKQGGDLKKHRYTHFQDKPHLCDACGKTFAQKNSLVKHSCVGAMTKI